MIRVVPFSRDECPKSPTSGPPLFTWREYYGFRNAVIGVLRFYGTVGPMGEMPVMKTWESSEAAWKPGTKNPDFFVVADMWNGWNRWNRVEASPWLVSARLLSELTAIAKGFPGWCVYLAIVKGGLTIFGDRILYEGDLFMGAQSVEDLGSRCESTKPE